MQFGKFENQQLTTIHYSAFKGNDITEYNLVIKSHANTLQAQIEGIAETWRAFSEKLIPGAWCVVFERIFLSDISNQHQSLQPIMFSPSVSLIQQPPVSGKKLEVLLVVWESTQNSTLALADEAVAHNGYSHYFDTGFAGKIGTDSYNQTLNIFDTYRNCLAKRNLCLFNNCLRTWIYVRDIDNNYKGMVEARNNIFEQEGLLPQTHFIASTGIEGASTQHENLVTMDMYAVDGIHPEQIKYLNAFSHLNPTHEYGVAFERGTAIDYGDRRHIFISGTASINNKGQIVHPLNIEKQTERVFENIAALLHDADATLNDMASMIVYLRDWADKDFVNQYIESNFPTIPTIMVLAPVCRTGWLIEIECTAAIPIHRAEFRSF